jgi:uncharacterized phage-associated protein
MLLTEHVRALAVNIISRWNAGPCTRTQLAHTKKQAKDWLQRLIQSRRDLIDPRTDPELAKLTDAIRANYPHMQLTEHDRALAVNIISRWNAGPCTRTQLAHTKKQAKDWVQRLILPRRWGK